MKILILIILLLATLAIAVELPLRPGRWTLTFEGAMLAVGGIQPYTVTNCLTAADVKSLGPVPDLIGPLARGCELAEHRVEGDRVFIRFACDQQITVEITGQAGEESFSGSLKVYYLSFLFATIKGVAKRAGACETTNAVDVLLARARHYALTEDGVGVVLIEGKENGSEVADSFVFLSVSPTAILEALVRRLGSLDINASHFWVRTERPESVLYYVLKNETYGPWRMDRGMTVVEMIPNVLRAKSGDTAERQLLAIMQSESDGEGRLVAQYEDACRSKVNQWHTRSVEHAVMTATFLAPAREIIATGAISKQLESVLSRYEKTSGKTVDRRNVISLAEALAEMFQPK